MPKHKELREQLGRIVSKVKEYAAARGYGVLHIIPNAYCIARPGCDTAVFAVAPPDRPGALEERGQVLVKKGALSVCKMGEWYSLAYLVNEKDGWYEVVA